MWLERTWEVAAPFKTTRGRGEERRCRLRARAPSWWRAWAPQRNHHQLSINQLSISSNGRWSLAYSFWIRPTSLS